VSTDEWHDANPNPMFDRRAGETPDLDEEELGERAAGWLLREELGAVYADVKDRAWSVVLGCYAKCVTSLGRENVPPQWRPSLDERGMWKMP
jgi:hypothetical protein